MKILKKGQAGTMQSSDLMVTVEPADELIIEIQSRQVRVIHNTAGARDGSGRL